MDRVHLRLILDMRHFFPLQWGHDNGVVESPLEASWRFTGFGGFNGATTMELWNGSDSLRVCCVTLGLEITGCRLIPLPSD
jgi:hypothetical protein